MFYYSVMVDSVVSQLLVLALLIATNIRIFFIHKSRKDVFVVLAPISLVLCLLLFLAWGVTLPSMLVLLLTIVTCVVNFHSMLRFFSGLVTEFYSVSLCVFSCLNLLLLVVCMAGIIILRPVKTPLEDLSVQKETRLLCGSFTNGYTERTSIFDPCDARITFFSPKETDSTPLPVVLFVADPRQTAEMLAPVAAQTASFGYKVVVADFSSTFEPALHRIQSATNPTAFSQKEQQFVQMSTAQYGALIKFLDLRPEQQIFLLGEGVCQKAMDAVGKLYSNIVDAWFCINGQNSNGTICTVEGWSNGFGAIEEYAPWLKLVLSKTANPFHCRDATRFNSILVSTQANKFFACENIKTTLPLLE